MFPSQRRATVRARRGGRGRRLRHRRRDRRRYGWAPPGKTASCSATSRSAGSSIRAGGAADEGDLVVGIVRRPDPVPCPNCAVGEWDMCRNGQYTERGIKQIDGFMSERWRIEPEYAMKVDRSLGLLGVLLEPTTVVAKAWEQVAAIGQRAFWEPWTALVTGAGPIGLLAALIGPQHGLDVHVLDRAESGPSPTRARARRDVPRGHRRGRRLRARRRRRVHRRRPGHRGAGDAVAPGRRRVPHRHRQRRQAIGGSTADIATAIVLENNVVVGSVNANKRHWYKAGAALARADRELARPAPDPARAAGALSKPPFIAVRTRSRS